MKIVDLISQIPTDTQERVKKASKRFGPYIRQAIRAEIRLQLNPRHRNEDFPHFKSEVPTFVDRIGYPKSLAQKKVPEDKELSASLSLWKPWLIMLRDSSQTITNALNKGTLNSVYDFLPDTRPLIPGVDDTCDLAEILLREISKYDLVKEILDVNEDILGQYVYQWNGLSRSSGHFSDEVYIKSSSKVVIYWGVVGLVAMTLGVNIEDLTAVVLTHEIAHAYTHLGFDIDKYRWGAENFSESAHEVKEGLAQYYTDRVVKSLEDRVPGAKVAFDALLPKQTDAYREHLTWVKDSTPEAVRNTLILLRKTGPIEKKQFGEALFQITMDYRQ